MAEITNKKMVSQLINKVGHEQYDKMISSERGKSDRVVHRAIRKQLQEVCSADELLDAILDAAIAEGWNKITKAGSVSSVLAAKSHKDLFPAELDNANIHLNGDTVGLRSAGVDVIEAQERAYIENKIKQDRAFARNMSVIGPLRSLMLENGCSSGEALDILRERGE